MNKTASSVLLSILLSIGPMASVAHSDISVSWDSSTMQGQITIANNLTFQATATSAAIVLVLENMTPGLPESVFTLEPYSIGYSINNSPLLYTADFSFVSGNQYAFGDIKPGDSYFAFDLISIPVQEGDIIEFNSGVWDMAFWSGSSANINQSFSGNMFLINEDVSKIAIMVPEPGYTALLLSGIILIGLLRKPMKNFRRRKAL